MDNCITTTRSLLTKLEIRYTKKYLEDNILSHPDHPSLLCISDTLEKYSMESLAVKVDVEKLKDLPLPCIVQLSDHGGMFHVLTELSDKGVKYIDDEENTIAISKEDFLKKWTGVCLLAEATETSAEPGIQKKLMEYRGMNFLKWASLILFSGWILLEVSQSPVLGSSLYFLGIIYMVLKLIGNNALVV